MTFILLKCDTENFKLDVGLSSSKVCRRCKCSLLFSVYSNVSLYRQCYKILCVRVPR